MIQRIKWALLLCIFYFVACKNSQSTEKITDTAINEKEYLVEPIEGSNRKMVQKFNAQNVLIEQGFIENGQKVGSWYTFFPEKGRIYEIWSYENGQKNGIHVVVNNSGRIDLYESYRNDILHGKRATFKQGTPVEEMSYSNGQLNGIFRGFNPKGRLQRLGQFKNGKQDGQYFQYDDEGKVILNATYLNGELIKTN